MIAARRVLVLLALALGLTGAAPAWSEEDRLFEALGFQRPSKQVDRKSVV